jgi:phenylpropionate dioxygenase-like ring-hydroxylating dioxygenase large terminal subunit
VIWKTTTGEYRAMDDACTHKGASLSGGKVCNDHVVCPYHGYEFNSTGTLVMVPGISFDPSPIYNLRTYPVIVKNNWVYINTRPNNVSEVFNDTVFFTEPEISRNSSMVQLEMDYNCYSRILSENSLDIMHIAFVHTFGNAQRPHPIREEKPTMIGPNHFLSRYYYEAGENSLARKIFGAKELIIENEFILPHTTVARVIFGDFVSTVITFALPIGENKSKLFVKTYRNFWENQLGDLFTYNSMYTTMLQDKAVVEGIDPEFMDGKFNMKFDKLQNTYKTFYCRFVHSAFKRRSDDIN